MCKKGALIPSGIYLHDYSANKTSSLNNCCNLQAIMVLQDEAIYPSNAFQHAAEFALEFRDRKELFLLLQQDGGHDCNSTAPRDIAANIMIMIECQLEHLACAKNTGGCSICNPSERLMGGINFCMQGIACERLESTAEVEEGTREAKSIREFVTKNQY